MPGSFQNARLSFQYARLKITLSALLFHGAYLLILRLLILFTAGRDDTLLALAGRFRQRFRRRSYGISDAMR